MLLFFITARERERKSQQIDRWRDQTEGREMQLGNKNRPLRRNHGWMAGWTGQMHVSPLYVGVWLSNKQQLFLHQHKKCYHQDGCFYFYLLVIRTVLMTMLVSCTIDFNVVILSFYLGLYLLACHFLYYNHTLYVYAASWEHTVIHTAHGTCFHEK